MLGIDIGSRGAKAILLHGGKLHTAQVATGVRMQDSANELLDDVLEAADITLEDIEHVVGTGYGRIALQFDGVPTEIVTEISCHAMGAHYLNARTRTIIDIGGQDSKAIQVDPDTGKVVKFIMNDKCAAGTGRFLEKAAGLLDYTIAEIGPASLQAETQPNISSQCTVFAESEIISFRARGVSREDIASGLHFASARRVRNLVSKVPLEADLVFTGGVSNNVGMKHALETLIGLEIKPTRLDMIYAGALGAAIYAQRFLVEQRKALRGKTGSAGADLSRGGEPYRQDREEVHRTHRREEGRLSVQLHSAGTAWRLGCRVHAPVQMRRVRGGVARRADHQERVLRFHQERARPLRHQESAQRGD